tara:strand:+ start:4321 stop:4572 length:252 start_codon:yes stop_codon:yes gene_type:complete
MSFAIVLDEIRWGFHLFQASPDYVRTIIISLVQLPLAFVANALLDRGIVALVINGPTRAAEPTPAKTSNKLFIGNGNEKRMVN